MIDDQVLIRLLWWGSKDQGIKMKIYWPPTYPTFSDDRGTGYKNTLFQKGEKKCGKQLALVYIYSISHWTNVARTLQSRGGQCFLTMSITIHENGSPVHWFPWLLTLFSENTILFPFFLVASEEGIYKYNFWAIFYPASCSQNIEGPVLFWVLYNLILF